MADYEDLQDLPDDDEKTTEYYFEEELNDTFQNARRTPLADQFATEKADDCARDDRSQRCKTYIDQIINITEDYNLTDKRASSANSRKGGTTRYDVQNHTPIRARMQSAMKRANPPPLKIPSPNSGQNLDPSTPLSNPGQPPKNSIPPTQLGSKINIQPKDIHNNPFNPSATPERAPLDPLDPAQGINSGYDFEPTENGNKFFLPKKKDLFERVDSNGSREYHHKFTGVEKTIRGVEPWEVNLNGPCKVTAGQIYKRLRPIVRGVDNNELKQMLW
jgi:hypothetical protein